MSRFDQYFLMEEADILEYVREKYDFFPADAQLTCKEIGDGNLNYVFRVQDPATGKSVILKHSGIETRAHSGRKVDIDRNRIEAEILQRQNELAPGFVPKIYGYDPIMCCCAMEDLKDYTILRTALLDYRTFPKFADQITTYMVNILLPTTDVALDHKQKKALVKSYINPDLCSITEQLVYDDAVGNFAGKNYVVAPLADFVEQEVYADKALRLEAAKLKFDFMEHAQALIHGDLHSGSIFVTEDSTKAFDPEFAFYGPMGYDVGNVIAHTLFALVHAEGTLPEGDARRTAFRTWALDTTYQIVDLFREKFLRKYAEVVTDKLAATEGFAEYYLDGVMADTAATAGMELIRRIVGVAKVKDITTIEDETRRAEMEKALVHIAKMLILERGTIRTGHDWKNVVEAYL